MLLLLLLLVSWSSLIIQSAALVSQFRMSARTRAERIVRRGHIRSSASRVLATSGYATAALLQVLGISIPGAGTLGPEALVIFTAVQLLWWTNSALDLRDRSLLKSPDDLQEL